MFTVHVVEEMRNSPYVVAVIMSLIYSRMRQFDSATASLPGPGCWMMAGIGAAQDRWSPGQISSNCKCKCKCR